jgi:hypothetical protein
MVKRMIAIGTAIILVGVTSYAFAQKTTELYIPLGKSPGLSGKYTVIGKIQQVDYQNKTFTISTSSGSYAITVTERTKIFLDRSKVKGTNSYGKFADCKKDMMAEVRFEKDSRANPAQWVKLQIER